MRVLAAFVLNVMFNFAIGLFVAKFLGPAEYGRFALALATAMTVQTAFLDWLRLGSTRFYSEHVRGENPSLRATLDVCFILIAFTLVIGFAVLVMAGVEFPLPNSLIALAIGTCIANGMFDFNSALVRARFHDRLYMRLVVVKNLLALVLTTGGAFFFHSAEMTLIGGIVSLSGSVMTARAALSDPGARPRLARAALAGDVMRYALPIVASNLVYMAIPLANRSIVAVLYGFSETGQFSLAYDIGTKAIQAIGSTLDVILFQIAVALHERHGADQSKRQLARNMAIVFAIVLPACTGLWLTLPSVEHLIVPEQFRGPFSKLLTLMMTGLFCFAMILYGINPIFQIAKRTAPLIGAALIAAVADPILLFLLPRSGDASSLAIAQSGAFLIAFVALTVFAAFTKPQWPPWRDLVATIVATAAMTAALLPLRAQEPGVLTLATQIAGGLAIYGLLLLVFDIAGLRAVFFKRLRPVVGRFRTP